MEKETFLQQVTILILVDGFLQSDGIKPSPPTRPAPSCHNPYFSRWFSAIKRNYWRVEDKYSHNPYFSRWFSAIKKTRDVRNERNESHNPYFSRWFSAI